jgi:hypothetical protein
LYSGNSSQTTVDLAYCEQLEAAIYEVFNEWLKGLKDGQEGFGKGQRIGGVMECVIIATGSSQPAVVFLVMRLRRSIVLQIEQVANAGSVAQTVAKQREAKRSIGKLLVEQCFWEGVLTVLEQ